MKPIFEQSKQHVTKHKIILEPDAKHITFFEDNKSVNVVDYTLPINYYNNFERDCLKICGEVLPNGNLCGNVLHVTRGLLQFDFAQLCCEEGHSFHVFHWCNNEWVLMKQLYCRKCDNKKMKTEVFRQGYSGQTMLINMSADKVIDSLKSETVSKEDVLQMKKEMVEIKDQLRELKEMLRYVLGNIEVEVAKEDFEKNIGKI